MRIIVDLGARFLKTIILSNDGVILTSVVSLSEGIENGLFNNVERLSESIFASIREAKENIPIPLSEKTHDELYITTCLKHCYITNSIKDIKEDKITYYSDNSSAHLVHTWKNKYSIGSIEVDTLIPTLIQNTKHNNVSVIIDGPAFTALSEICTKNDSSLVKVFYGNCTPIKSNNTLRIDVGYCGTRVFCNKNIYIIETGLQELILEIAKSCNIPTREAEKLMQVVKNYSTHKNSVFITELCRKFITDLFTKIILVTNTNANNNLQFELQGGILHIPFICDFIEGQFGVRTFSLNNQNNDFINCQFVIDSIINQLSISME